MRLLLRYAWFRNLLERWFWLMEDGCGNGVIFGTRQQFEDWKAEARGEEREYEDVPILCGACGHPKLDQGLYAAVCTNPNCPNSEFYQPDPTCPACMTKLVVTPDGGEVCLNELCPESRNYVPDLDPFAE